MARALSVIRDDVRQIIGQTDSSNSNFTPSQLNIWINEAYRDASIRLEVATTTETTYTTGTTVTLGTGTVSVDTVKFLTNDGTTTSWKALQVIDISDLTRIDPNWENATTGIPDYAVKFGPFSMRLYPPPNTSNDAQANGLKTYGLTLPTELSADVDETVWPHHLDDLLSHYAAYRCFSRLNNEARSVQELTLYRGMLRDYKKMATNWSRGRERWVWTDTDGSSTRDLQID